MPAGCVASNDYPRHAAPCRPARRTRRHSQCSSRKRNRTKSFLASLLDVQLLPATFSYFQLLPATFSYFQLLSATFSYFQLLSVTFSYMSATTVPHAIHEQYTRGGPIKHTVGHFCPLFTQLIEKVGVFANLRFARFLARFAQTNSHTIFLTTANVFTSCRRSFASRPNHVSSRRRRVCVALGPTLGGRDCQYPTL